MLNSLKKIMLVSAVVASSTVSAQAMQNRWADTACSTMGCRSFGYISPGLAWNNLDNINNALAAQGISAFKGMAPTLSLGMNRELGRLVMESSITWRYWFDNLDGATRTSLGAGDLIFNTGFNLFPFSAPLTLVPYLGIGGGLNTIHIRNDSKSLTNLLGSTEPDAMLWQGTFLVNLGIGSDLLLSKNDMLNGLALGLRVGYLFDPFADNMRWYSNGVYINDIPALNQSGAYIRLILGGWGNNRMMQEKK